jgi:hypothetical protein
MSQWQVVSEQPASEWDVVSEQPMSRQPPARLPAQQAMINLIGGAVRGAGSIGATFARPFESADDNQERRRRLEENVVSFTGADPESLLYQGGKIGAEIAGTAGAPVFLGRAVGVAAPTLGRAIQTAGFAGPNIATRTAGGAIAGGVSAGLVNPEDAGTGALVGGVMPGAIQVAGAAGRAAGRAVRPNINNPELARRAIEQYGIPLGPADISASAATKATRSILNDAPFTGGIGERQKEAVQEGFNRAVGRTFGADAPKLTPQVMDQAKGRIADELNRVWSNNALQVDGDLVADLVNIRNKAVERLNPDQAAQVERQLRVLLDKAEQIGDEAIGVNGSFANNWQSELRMVAESEKGLHRKMLEDARAAVIRAFNRSVSPEDAAALTQARKQYKAFKTVEPITRRAEVGIGGREVGDIPAALLPQQVLTSYGQSIAQSPFADLSQIGSQYLVDRVARTGGGPRAALQNTGIGAALLGSGMMTNPLVPLAAIGGGVATQRALGSPEMARRMLNAGQGSTLSDLLMRPEVQQAILRSAPVVAAQ